MEKYDTLKYYDDNAEKYYEQTKNCDMTENYKHFLALLRDNAYILDFGCGSGRDSRYFIEEGYSVKAIDGSKKLCKLASKYIGQEVECMKFDELSDISKYDGIWACSSILHVERKKLPNIIDKMEKALKDDGVIYISFKIGNQEIVQDGKYYNYMTKELLEDILKHSNLKIVDYFESITSKNINIPSTTWGNYLIKKNYIV